MPETRREVREKMDFNQLLDEMEGSKKTFRLGSSKEFEAVKKALQEVADLSDKPVRGNVEDMIKAHERLGKACDAYLKARTGAITGKGKDRLELVEVISSLQKREADAVNTFRDPATFSSYSGSAKKWSEVLADHRANEINVTGKELSTVGAGSSTRTVVPLENNRRGFFTKNQIFLSEDVFYQDLIDKAGSENVKDAYKGFLGNDNARNAMNDLVQGLLSIDNFNEILKNKLNTDSGLEDMRETIKWTRMSPAQKEEFVKGVKEFGKFKTMSETLKMADVKVGGDLPLRNVASSRLAALLGQDTLLAKSDVVCLRNGNELQKGVMMEEARGLDYNVKDDQHLETFGKVNDYSDSRLQIQITSLEVMDYLAGQVDRNIGNMFYQLEEDKSGNQKLIGIQGIDNDAAFGNLVPEKGQKFIGTIVDLKNITMMDINLMARIQFVNQNPDSLKYIFGDILRPSEIKALGDRFQQVQDRVNNGSVEIKEQGDWNDDTAKALATKNGYLQQIKFKFDTLKKQLAEEKEKERLNAKELEAKENGTSKRAERHENKNNATKTSDAQKNRTSIKIGGRGL